MPGFYVFFTVFFFGVFNIFPAYAAGPSQAESRDERKEGTAIRQKARKYLAKMARDVRVARKKLRQGKIKKKELKNLIDIHSDAQKKIQKFRNIANKYNSASIRMRRGAISPEAFKELEKKYLKAKEEAKIYKGKPKIEEEDLAHEDITAIMKSEIIQISKDLESNELPESGQSTRLIHKKIKKKAIRSRLK
ncbi:hypothetical protein ACFL35_13940 [Candidatus Riflebacteria bacterium]